MNNYSTPEKKKILNDFLDKQYAALAGILDNVILFEKKHGSFNEEYQLYSKQFISNVLSAMDCIEEAEKDGIEEARS